MTAYSYIRFSSEKQSSGDSLKRQEKRLDQWVDSNPSIKLSEMSYKDLGVSGFSGKHVAEGALGAFLEAINKGKIKTGDMLLIESLDRLGRLKELDMIEIIIRIIKAGVIIESLEDGTRYDVDSFSQGTVYVLVAKIQQAHQYSSQLSERISSAKRRTRASVKSGELNKITKNSPFWCYWSSFTKRFEVKDKEKKIVDDIFSFYLRGDGIEKVRASINSKYKTKYHGSRINRVLFDRCVLGEISLKSKDVIENYYPIIVDRVKYHQAVTLRDSKQSVRDMSAHSSREKPPTNIWKGLVHCVCGSECTLLNKSTKDKVVFSFICKQRKFGCTESTGINMKDVNKHFNMFVGMTLQAYSSQETVPSKPLATVKNDTVKEHEQVRRTKEVYLLTGDSEDLKAFEKAREVLADKKQMIKESKDKGDRQGLYENIMMKNVIRAWHEFDHTLTNPQEDIIVNKLLEYGGYRIIVHKGFVILKIIGKKVLTFSKIAKNHKEGVSRIHNNKIFIDKDCHGEIYQEILGMISDIEYYIEMEK